MPKGSYFGLGGMSQDNFPPAPAMGSEHPPADKLVFPSRMHQPEAKRIRRTHSAGPVPGSATMVNWNDDTALARRSPNQPIFLSWQPSSVKIRWISSFARCEKRRRRKKETSSSSRGGNARTISIHHHHMYTVDVLSRWCGMQSHKKACTRNESKIPWELT